MLEPRYLVGIDLGTSNIALSYLDLHCKNNTIKLFKIPQYVAPGQIAELHLLPAYHLHAQNELFVPSDVLMPWQSNQAIIGHLAKELSYSYPNLSVNSAKSYLSHPVMDAYKAFLPLGSYDQNVKISPFDVTVDYLNYLIGAWNHKNPEHPLEKQSVVITIPASFDDQARKLTQKASHTAGFENIELLEEPIAAFYHWFESHQLDTYTNDQSISEIALVLDIGGGTSDFSLIKLELNPTGPKLQRIATGKHLLLGGDNMDYYLTEKLLTQLNEPIKSSAKKNWISQIQNAKENMFNQLTSNNEHKEIKISINTKQSKLLNHTKSVNLTNELINQLIDGFFPDTPLEPIKNPPTIGLRQFGLPFESNPSITAHIADFLYQNADEIRNALNINDSSEIPVPKVILFNGGIFHSPILANRISQVIGSWQKNTTSDIEVLYNNAPSLAVSYGASSYLKAKHLQSVIIHAGAQANYFIQVSKTKALCVLTKGIEQGNIYTLDSTSLKLKTGQVLRFPLFFNRKGKFELGKIIPLDDSYKLLGTIYTNLKGEKVSQNVTLLSQLTSAGTLELTAVTPENKKYPLEFGLHTEKDANLINHTLSNQVNSENLTVIDQEKIETILQKIKSFFNDKSQSITSIKESINHINGPINKWSVPFRRALWDQLFSIKHLRFKRASAEQYFYSLSGYLLTPINADFNDNHRIEALSELYIKGIEYPHNHACVTNWWVMWRRVAPEVISDLQLKLYNDAKSSLLTKKAQLSNKNKIALDEKIRLLSVLEKLPLNLRIELGNQLVKRVLKNLKDRLSWWSLGRIGNRQPLSSLPGELIPTEIIENWLDQLLPLISKTKVKNPLFIIYSMVLLCRKLNDNEYQLSSHYEEKIIKLLKKLKASTTQLELISVPSLLDKDTSNFLYDQEMPLGISI